MNDLKNAFLKLPEVQRIHELEHLLDQNENLKHLMLKLKSIQKQMVHAKEFHQVNQYAIYKKEYDSIYAQILDFPFVEEYLDLLNTAFQYLNDTANIVQDKINKELS